ncbi:MAG: hypothetical protein C4335_04145 [Armatimonadota bacterium]
MKRLCVRHLGPLEHGEVQFGDLTVLVGPQATGKSLFLQLAKLLVDMVAIRQELRRFNIRWGNEAQDLFEVYFGEGMSALYSKDKTEVELDDKPVDWGHMLQTRGRLPKSRAPKMFYIPAQRVITIRDGLTRPFTDYRAGDPFVVREFSEILHQLVQTEFGGREELFPVKGRLKQQYRDLIEKHVFRGLKLQVDTERFQRRVVLQIPDKSVLPFLAWSSGQREFVPLLLGLYWLLPPAKVPRRGALEWVVIEEPEMGLHPNAVSVVILLILELLQRGYRVCVSTHSTHVLDIVWALGVFQRYQSTEADVRALFNLPASMSSWAREILAKQFAVFYFQPDGHVRDISALDPGAPDMAEAGWGGLTELSANVSEIVGRVVARSAGNGAW